MNNKTSLTYKNSITYYLIYAGAPFVIAFLCLTLIYVSFLSRQYEGIFFSFVFVVFSFKFLIAFRSHTWVFNRESGLLEIINKNLLGKKVGYKAYELSRIERLYCSNYVEISNDKVKRNHKGLYTLYLLIGNEEIQYFNPQSEKRTWQTAKEISQLLNIHIEKAV